MADDIGRPGEDPRDVARRSRRQGIRYRAAQAAANQPSGPTMTPSTQSMVPYREQVPTAPEGGRGGPSGQTAAGGGREPALRREGMPSVRVPQGAADAMRGAMQSPMARAMGTGRGAAIGRAAEGAMRLGEAARRAYRSMPARTPDTSPDEGPPEPRYTMTPGYEDSMAAGSVAGRERPRPQPARRPAPRRNVDPEGTEAAADAERERQRIAAIRAILEGGDLQPQERDFLERLGLRRTYETGEGAPSTGSLSGDLRALGRALGFKKGGKVMKYEDGGPVRVPGKKPGFGGPKSATSAPKAPRMRDMMTEQERREFDAPLTEAEKERMRSSGFKKGGAVKPKAKTAMKKGGVVKKAAGGKVAAPKKMMKGGKVTAKPVKKMMGGGRAMYAKGGMTRGCK